MESGCLFYAVYHMLYLSVVMRVCHMAEGKIHNICHCLLPFVHAKRNNVFHQTCTPHCTTLCPMEMTTSFTCLLTYNALISGMPLGL